MVCQWTIHNHRLINGNATITGKITAEYHTAGNEITGSTVKQTEKLINIDDMLISSTFVAEVDELKNHFEVFVCGFDATQPVICVSLPPSVNTCKHLKRARE